MFSKCEPQNEFPYAPCWYDVPVTTQDNFKHYRQFKEHNKKILALHFIYRLKERNSIISPCTNTTVNNSSITEANYNTQT